MSELTVTGRLARSPFANRRRQKDVSASLPPAPQAATPPPGPTRLARMLALAYHVERLIDAGQLEDYAHAARVVGVTRARMSQVASLVNLPIEVQEAVLTGKCEKSERDLRGRSQPSTSKVDVNYKAADPHPRNNVDAEAD